MPVIGANDKYDDIGASDSSDPSITELTPTLRALASGGRIPAPLMAVIGDSRAANGYNRVTIPYSTRQAGVSAYAVALCDGCFRVPDFGWLATGGQRVTTGTATSDLAPMSVQVTQAIDAGFQYATVFPFGTNDYEASIGPVQTVDAVWAEYKAQVARLVAAGMVVWVCTDPGVRTAEAATTAKPKHTSILRQNELIRSLAYTSPGRVFVIDLHASSVDPASPTASALTSWYADTVHFNGIGNYWQGKEVGRNWLLNRPPAPVFTRSNFDNYAFDASLPNKLANSLFLTDTGTTGVPDEWKGGAAGATSLGSGVGVTPSIVSAPNGIGNALRLVWTGTNAGTFGKFRSVDLAARIPNGTTVFLLVKIRVSAATNATMPRIKLEGPGLNGALMEFENDATQPEANTFTLISAPFVKTSAMTTVQFDITQKFLGAGGITHELMQAQVMAYVS